MSTSKLLIGVCNIRDNFHEKIYELFEGFDTVRSYIDSLLVRTREHFTDFPKTLEKVLQQLKEQRLKVNTKKSFF